LVDNSGYPQLLQHCDGDVHKKLAKSLCSASQGRITFTTTSHMPSEASSQTDTNNSTSIVFNKPAKLGVTILSNDVTRAEIIWAAKTASSNFSFRSSDGIAETFHAMFKCPVSERFSMSRSKLSYIFSDGLGPAVTEELVMDIKASGSVFSLQFDDTTQGSSKEANGFVNSLLVTKA